MQDRHTQVKDQGRASLPPYPRDTDNRPSPAVSGVTEQSVLTFAEAAGQAWLMAALERRTLDEPLPLSWVQERMWLLRQLQPESAAYHADATVRLRGTLDVPRLELSLQEIVRRHAVLRTQIRMVDGQPRQVIHADARLPLGVQNIAEQDLSDLLQQQLHAPFDLEHGPLIRARLYALAPDDHVLQIVIHNVAADTQSMAVLMHELAVLYKSFAHGTTGEWEDLPLQYANYALWEKERGGGAEDSLAYWRRQLDSVPPLSLPTDRARPAVQSTRGAHVRAPFATDLLAQLTHLGQSEATTLPLVILTAYVVLLYRYSGQEDFAIGMPVDNRWLDATQPLIGPFEDIVALRANLSGAPTFRQLLRRLAATVATAYRYQDVPFERLINELQPERDPSHTPIFQVMFNSAVAEWGDLQFPGLAWERIEVDSQSAQLDLALELVGCNHLQCLGLEYNTDLYDRPTMDRMLAQLQVLLHAIAAAPDLPVAHLEILPDAERRQVLVEWNATAEGYPDDLCIHHLFEAQVARTPAATALIYGGEQLTYGELNLRANQLAHYLRTLGVGPEMLVGVCVDRSLEMIVALLGILKAGGAYLPLDPVYPRDRLAFMLADTQAEILLTQASLVPDLPEFQGHLICLDTGWAAVAVESKENPVPVTGPQSLAYIIYTSGSTGQPKGTQIEHRSLVNYVTAMSKTLELGPGDRLLQFASISFDTAAEEIFCTLTRGATLVLRTHAMLESMVAFLEACRDLQLTILDLPTAYWHALTVQLAQGDVALPPSIRIMLIGGEAALPERVQVWRQHVDARVRFINAYGPTESTIVATKWELSPALRPDATLPVVPIGRPVANAQVYLLDTHLQPVPIGIPGEIHIGGAGLARGYLNQPELTGQKFIPNPFLGEGGARLYKTGDLGRFLPDGNIEFLGRRDNQVKVRGYRIELGEIETVLNEHPAVGKGVVLAWDDGGGSKQVVAYVEAAPGHEPTAAELRQYLDARLPNYMVPAAVVLLAAIPLTPNDKIDRKRLPQPGQLDLQSSEYMAPRTPLETELAQIWARALNRERVGIRDHFFENGGNSLQAALLFIQIEARTGHRLPLATLFQAPTIEQLAAVMADDNWSAPWNPLVPIQPNGTRPPLFCVHGHGGDVVGYHDLARLLGPDQPFYGIQAKGLNGHDQPHTDIDSMVADYVHWVRSVQPHGPYYLGGYCYGGVVAYEMARQLEAAGEEVGLVAVMEGYAVERAQVQKQLWKPQVMWSLLRNLPWWLKDNLRPEGPYLRNWTTLGYNPAAELPERGQVLAAHDQAMAAYKPRPYGGRVTLFRVKTMSLFRAHDPSMGWAEVAEGGVDIRMVPGAHYNILEQPYVVGLADHLRMCLAKN